MSSSFRIDPQFVAFLLLAGIAVECFGQLQSNAQAPAPAANRHQGLVVRSVRVVPGQDGPMVEIVSSSPVVPTVQKLDGPPRLVIDLPNATFSLRRKRYAYRSGQISAVRVDQYQNTPPIARVVVDLLKPSGYTWDAVGNSLIVRLHRMIETSEISSAPAFAQGVRPAVTVSSASPGTVLLAGNRVAAGSSVTAGAGVAILRLARGGEVRVCPGTTVSVTSSQNGAELLLGISTGALEAHYALNDSADSVLTPDFRILLAGPGEFHYAVSADSRGDTCVRALPGNTASVIVSELMGEGTYQVKPAEQVVFRSGRVNLPGTVMPEDCGCPEPAVPIIRASAPSPPAISDSDAPASTHIAQPSGVKPVLPPVSVSGSQSSDPPSSPVIVPRDAADLPPSHPNDVHVHVDAPLVFRANDPQPQPAPALQTEPQRRTHSSHPVPLTSNVALSPQSQAKLEHRGVFRKIKGFFAAMFR